MKYIETEIKLSPEGSKEAELTCEMLSFLLGEIGYESFVQEEESLKAYIQKETYSQELLEEVLAAELLSQKVEGYHSQEMPDINWNEEWEKNYYQPVVVQEGRLAVRASFHPPVQDVDLELIIDPKMAFGTGNHATTLGMLQLILDEADQLPSSYVLDMGCGSGILGILCMKLGAKRCTSIDIDEWSIRNSRENAEVNGVELTLIQGDASHLRSLPKVDLLMANINRNIILNDLPLYIEVLRQPEGRLLLSGFLKEDLPVITEALSSFGFRVKELLNPSGEWIAIRASR